jgi:hippurate hydrolase
MLDDGFLSHFPKPDAGVALHVGNQVPAGKVGVHSGYLLASADSIRVTIYGKGAHGALPETSIDPIVIAARTVIALQTIVSREVAPGQAAVVTVGYIHAGTKNNIIPDQAELGLTVRTYEPTIRKHVLASIDRIIKAEAEAAGAPRPPLIDHYESTNALYEDPYLVKRLTPVLESALGKDKVESVPPMMASEDYSYFIEAGIPSFFYVLGGPSPDKFAQAKATGVPLPSNHSPLFAPDAQPALRTAIAAEVAVLRNLLSGSSDDLRKSLGAEPPMAGL